MEDRLAFVATCAGFVVLTLAFFLGLHKGGSPREKVVRGYGLQTIVEAMRIGDVSSVLASMAPYDLCTPARELPAECIGGSYIEAGRIYAPLVAPNLRSKKTLGEWMRESLDDNRTSLALVAGNAAEPDGVLFLTFVLRDPRNFAGDGTFANGLALWVLPGDQAVVQQAWWLDVDGDFVDTLLNEPTRSVAGEYRNVLYCDSGLLSGCPEE